MAYYELEPFGEEREDWRTARLLAEIHNTVPRKGGTARQPKDFMPMFGQPDEEEAVGGPVLREKWAGIRKQLAGDARPEE